MLHGDILTLTERGISVHDKALRPLGIYDGSVCWGVWIADPRKHDAGDSPRHLVVSAIHPSSWPFLMRIRMYIQNEPGALERACRFFDANDLSILLAQCSPTGFDNATLNVIAECTHEDLARLKEWKESFDLQHPEVRNHGKLFLEARDIANRVAVAMLKHGREVVARLEACHRARESALHGGYADYDEATPPLHLFSKRDLTSAPFDRRWILHELRKSPEAFADDAECAATYDAQFQPPFTVRYMHRLARFAIYGGGPEVPFSMRYEAEKGLLRLERDEAFNAGDTPWEHLPCPAIVMLNSRDKYLRIRPTPPGDLKHRLTRIYVDYSVTPVRRRAAEASKGMLWRICSAFRATEPPESAREGDAVEPGDEPARPRYLVDLLDMNLKWTRQAHSSQTGRASFIGDAAPRDYEEVKRRVRGLEPMLPASLRGVRITGVEIHEYPRSRLFVSMHFGHPREAALRAVVCRLAAQRGFEARLVETHVRPATGHVLQCIRESQAFLQLLSFRSHEGPDDIDLTWLDFEYGVACGLSLPSLRLVDVVRVPYDWWQQRISTNPDHRAKEFRTDVSDADLEASIGGAIDELAVKLARPGDH